MSVVSTACDSFTLWTCAIYVKIIHVSFLYLLVNSRKFVTKHLLVMHSGGRVRVAVIDDCLFDLTRERWSNSLVCALRVAR